MPFAACLFSFFTRLKHFAHLSLHQAFGSFHSLSVLDYDFIHAGNFDIFQVYRAGCLYPYLAFIARINAVTKHKVLPDHYAIFIAELVKERVVVYGQIRYSGHVEVRVPGKGKWPNRNNAQTLAVILQRPFQECLFARWLHSRLSFTGATVKLLTAEICPIGLTPMLPFLNGLQTPLRVQNFRGNLD